MTDKLADKSRDTPRFSYAVESCVDRTTREQNRFLEHCKLNRTDLTVFATTGATFNGIVWEYDRETILFGGKGKNAEPRLIRKSFISLIVPRQELSLFDEYRGLGTAKSKNRKERFLAALVERFKPSSTSDCSED